MSTEPPTPTVANWRCPEVLRHSFQQVEHFLPAVPIRRGAGPVVALPPALTSLDALAVPGFGSVSDVLEATETDAWLVLHRGRLMTEGYVAPMTPSTRHLLMSVSKSIVAVVVGALVESGVLAPELPVPAYVPELTGSGYDGARLRDVLDMRTGVRFSEDYLDPDAEVCLLDEAVGWAPARQGSPATLTEFLRGLAADRAHGGHFQYRSCETDVLGWVVEAASGRRFADVAAELLWGRLGAEGDAVITVDSEGTGMFDGGICASLRDLGRFGAMLLQGGESLTGERIISQDWVDDVFTGSPDLSAAFAAGPHGDLLPGGHYHNQFWVPAGGDVVLCVGIHGQLVYVDRAARMVAVKLSSWPLPIDVDRMDRTLAMFDAIARHLSADGA